MSTIFPHYPHYPQQRVCKTAPIFFWKWMCYDRMKQGVVGMGGNMKDRWSVPIGPLDEYAIVIANTYGK